MPTSWQAGTFGLGRADGLGRVGGLSALARFPGEEADGEQHAADPPSGDNEDIRPADGGAEEPALHALYKVPTRKPPGEPQDPRRSGVAERDEDPGQELNRE